MKTNTRLRVTAAMLLLGVVPGLSAQGHHPGPPVGATEQQKQMHQQMATMQDMMQRMGTMTQRSQQMSTEMNERMRQMSAEQMTEHRTMQQMSDHMATAGGHMKGLMEQMDAMMRDHEVVQAPGMQKDLNEMHKQLGATTTSMEKMLQAMERMNKRLSGGAPVPPKP